VIADEYADESTENAQSSFDVDAIKKRAKKAKRNARKKEQRTEDENVNPDESDSNSFIKIDSYVDESQIGVIMELIGKELSEPYSIYTYRTFLSLFVDIFS
jgi:peptide alpha-N-acetyltransferase